MKNSIKNLSVFVCICTVMTLLLALTNSVTEPVIIENQNASANKALLEVMPEGSGFETVALGDYTLPATVTEVYRESSGLGYVVKLVTAGYGTDMVIMCGVDRAGVVTGAVCLSSNETLSKEKTYGENFLNKDAALLFLFRKVLITILLYTQLTAPYLFLLFMDLFLPVFHSTHKMD